MCRHHSSTFLAGMYMKVSSPHTTLSMKAANSQQKSVASCFFAFL